MRRTLAIGLILTSLLSSCDKKVRQKQTERPPTPAVAAIEVTKPPPSPLQILKVENEIPEPPRPISGQAERIDQVRKQTSKQVPVPSPRVRLQHDYPRAKRNRKSFKVPAFQTGSHPTFRPSNKVRYQNRVLVNNHIRNGAGPNLFPSHRPPSNYRHPQPVSSYKPPNVVPKPQSAPATASYPKAQSYPRADGASRRQRAWENEHKRLKSAYLQARADALNIKYNKGKPRFNARSPQVINSASAPPSLYFKTRPQVPEDRLGQAFVNSEQARDRLRRHEKNRYRSASYTPPTTQSYPMTPSVPRPHVPSAHSYQPSTPQPYTPLVPGYR
jgi:hypothetical protein